jgi:protein ImuB
MTGQAMTGHVRTGQTMTGQARTGQAMTGQAMTGQALTATRTAALWVPDWSVAAAVAEGVVGAHLPVAVHDGRGVTAVSARARAEGVRRGMRRRSAQGMCPELVLVPADEGRDIRAFEPLVQAIETVVAGVEVARPGVALMPARGPSRHVGSEVALAELLVGRVAEETGSECQVGIADGVLAAVLAARDGVIVPSGEAARFLAPRDVRDLQYVATTREARIETEALTDLLRRLGLRTLGAFASLSHRDVLARFGGSGVLAHRLAQGREARPPVARRPEQDVVVRAELDPPAMRIDAAAFAARRLAEQLHDRMLRRGVLCARLRIEARSETGQELVRTWRIDGALTSTEMTDRVRWQLEGWITGRSGAGPSAPLVRLELAAEEVSPANVAQDGLWGHARRGEVQASRAALRIQGMLGADGVLVPVLQGGREPRDRVRLVAWGDEASPLRPTSAPWPGRIPSPLPATVPVEPVLVQVRDPEGRVLRVSERGELTSRPDRLEIVSGTAAGAVPGRGSGRVEAWAGPWPVTERWWADRPRRRAYLQLLLATGRGVLVATDVDAGSWWLEGVYD